MVLSPDYKLELPRELSKNIHAQAHARPLKSESQGVGLSTVKDHYSILYSKLRKELTDHLDQLHHFITEKLKPRDS